MRLGRITLPALIAACLLAAGCGRDEPDLVNGKKLFAGEGQCASCHTLARANAKGNRGPNLDEAFGPSRAQGLGQETIAGVVRQKIEQYRDGSIMRANLVRGDDARDVAAYVALVAGLPGRDTGALARAGRPEISNKPVVARGGQLEIAADPTGALAFIARRAQAKSGTVRFSMPNPSPVEHNIAVKGAGIDQKGPVVGQGGNSRFQATLRPGKYTFYCSVPGHEPGGMRGELTVE